VPSEQEDEQEETTMSKNRNRKQAAQASPTLALPCAQSTPQSDKALEDQTDYGREVSVNRANRLLRTFAAQVEALKKHRSKGEQHFTVEHVHVHSGGQAVVGAVNQGHAGTEAPRSRTGGEERNGEE